MCRQLTCERCGRPTWAGCGAHVEQVLGHVPKDQRCRCREGAGERSWGSSSTRVAPDPSAPEKGGRR